MSDPDGEAVDGSSEVKDGDEAGAVKEVQDETADPQSERKELPPEATGAEVSADAAMPEIALAATAPETEDLPETPEAVCAAEVEDKTKPAETAEAAEGKMASLWKGAASRIAIKKMEPGSVPVAVAESGGDEGGTKSVSAKWDELLVLSTEAIKKSNAEEAVAAEEPKGEVGNTTAQATSPARVEGSAPQDDVGDEPVYLTDAYLEWERLYLLRVAKRVHRLVCDELTRAEEALFMLYVHHDSDLNGVVTGSEAGAFLEALDNVLPGTSTDTTGLLAEDGTVSFISLLTWNTQRDKETTTTFSFTSAAVGLMGSGAWACDARLEALSINSLKVNVVGYRRMLRQLRQHKEGIVLQGLHEAASEKESLVEAMPTYYQTLAEEFSGDGEILFELFNEVDESANLLLELSEVEALVRLIDQTATEDDVKRYLYEIMAEGGLTFANLVDWWEQARSVSNSLVAEKGTTLLASMKGRAASARLGGYLGTETAVMRNIRAATDAGGGRLESLRDAYCRTYSEFRDYQMTKELQDIEAECAKL